MVMFGDTTALIAEPTYTINVESRVMEQLVAVSVAKMVNEVVCVNPLIGKESVSPFPTCGFP